MTHFIVCVALALAGCSADFTSGDASDLQIAEQAASLRAASAAPSRAARVLVSTSDGTVHALSPSGEDEGVFAQAGLDQPAGLALDRHGNVYVASTGNNTVHAFSGRGEDLGVFASAGLSVPTDLAFDAHGTLFVANQGDNSVVAFSEAGKALGRVVSLLGRGCVTGMVVDRDGNLLVADPCLSVVRKFTTTGGELGIFSQAGLSNPLSLLLEPSGDVLVVNSDNAGAFANTIHRFSAVGEDLGIFADSGLNFAGSVAFDGQGRLLVANEQQRPGRIDYAIRKLASDGSDLGDWAILSAQPRSLVVVPRPSESHCRSARTR